MRVEIRGRRYSLKFGAASVVSALGSCDAPDSKGKTIRIRRSLRGRDRMTVVVHELLHAALWDLSEESVDETAEAVARVLWSLGYRCDEE